MLVSSPLGFPRPLRHRAPVVAQVCRRTLTLTLDLDMLTLTVDLLTLPLDLLILTLDLFASLTLLLYSLQVGV